MENFGWFGSIEICIVLPCTSKFSTDFAVLLSFTSVLSWFQGMGGKSYLLGLLGLLLISCKCTLAFFCLRKSWVLQVFQFAQFPRIIFMLTKNFISFQCTWKQIVLRQICREGFGRFLLKVSFRVFGLWVITKFDTFILSSHDRLPFDFTTHLCRLETVH